MPRRPSLLDRFFNDLSDALHDTVEGIIEDAEDVFRAKFQPPAPQPPPHSPRPGKRGTSRSRKSAHPKAQESHKTSPGASQASLYGILGVRDDAPAEVIQGAWKALCRIYHPDAGGDGERIKLINVAYETLSDPKKRREYDRGLRRGQ